MQVMSFSDRQDYAFSSPQYLTDLNKEKAKSGIKVLLRYIGAVYVDPGKTESNIKIISNTIKNDQLNISVQNSGKRHQVLTNLKLILKQGEENLILDSALLPEFAGENVLAGQTRNFHVNISKNPFINTKNIKAELDFEK